MRPSFILCLAAGVFVGNVTWHLATGKSLRDAVAIAMIALVLTVAGGFAVRLLGYS